MKQIYRSNPYMHGDGKMILSICKYVPSIMAPTNDKHIKVKNGALMSVPSSITLVLTHYEKKTIENC